MSRTVCWFSCGAASAVATKLTLATEPAAEVVYTDPGSEHPDNERFLADCETWFGKTVTVLRSSVYADTWDVWRRRGVIRLHHGGSPCTGEMKRALRFEFQRPTDIQVFGFTEEERDRADRLREQNFELDMRFPLIEAGLSKADTLAMVERAGIEMPAMYRLGYSNNNCIGCPKGGMGYWNKIRRDFPDVFDRMAALEREVGSSIFNEGGRPLFLDELATDRGRHDEPTPECSLLCHLAELNLESAE
ncbi:MAG: hypothetical protein KGL39_06555 [Patescibacteria group bacterium]|nr:hypothetical protein [Patescibacteria group bacterium]